MSRLSVDSGDEGSHPTAKPPPRSHMMDVAARDE
jgi:hypothetical protein